MNNVFISSAKNDKVVENFAKSKREELEKMIPGFINDRKFTDIVLNFYERGIRDGAQMMLEQMTENALTAVEMARKEMMEKAVEHLRRNLCNYFDASREDYDKFIEDFKIVINEKL